MLFDLQDSNLRPSAPEADALSTELPGPAEHCTRLRPSVETGPAPGSRLRGPARAPVSATPGRSGPPWRRILRAADLAARLGDPPAAHPLGREPPGPHPSAQIGQDGERARRRARRRGTAPPGSGGGHAPVAAHTTPVRPPGTRDPCTRLKQVTGSGGRARPPPIGAASSALQVPAAALPLDVGGPHNARIHKRISSPVLSVAANTGRNPLSPCDRLSRPRTTTGPGRRRRSATNLSARARPAAEPGREPAAGFPRSPCDQSTGSAPSYAPAPSP